MGAGGLPTRLMAMALVVPGAAAGDRFAAVARGRLEVTEGRLEGADRLLRVEVAKLRAVAPGADGSAAELRFTYLGPTREAAPLRSGELREQLGLKLRAADGCNVLYAMWRLAPRAGVVVSVKRNPGQNRSRDCTNHGYRNVKPLHERPVPSLGPGSAHVLAAMVRGDRLEVRVDGAVVWEGTLPDDALELRGPPGLRTDNVRLDFEFAATSGRGPDGAAR